MEPRSLEGLADELRQFARERDWDQFHSPKNLASALTIEASELLELFLWASSPVEQEGLIESKRQAIADEIGDILLFLIRFADVVHIDPLEAARAKIAKNRLKYPADKVRGSSKKYTEYE